VLEVVLEVVLELELADEPLLEAEEAEEADEGPGGAGPAPSGIGSMEGASPGAKRPASGLPCLVAEAASSSELHA